MVPATRNALIYDADCGFCTTSASWISARLASGSTILPSHDLDLDAHGLTLDDVMTAAYWIDDSGTAHRGSVGIALALRNSSAPWSWAGAVMAVPPVSWLAAAVYPIVAKNRHRLPGATAACAIDTDGPDEA